MAFAPQQDPRAQTPVADPLDYDRVPSLSFRDAPIGTTYKGVITRPAQLLQSRDFESGEPATWSDGKPKLSVVIQLDVDGEARSLWAVRPSAMFNALVAAQKEAGAGTMQVGGELWVKFSGTQKNSKNPKLNDQKLYQCRYLPPKPEDPFEEEAHKTAQTATPMARAAAPRPGAPPAPRATPSAANKPRW